MDQTLVLILFIAAMLGFMLWSRGGRDGGTSSAWRNSRWGMK